jgi:hypothetical protein
MALSMMGSTVVDPPQLKFDFPALFPQPVAMMNPTAIAIVKSFFIVSSLW